MYHCDTVAEAALHPSIKETAQPAYPPLADVELNELMNGQPIRESIFP